MKILILRVAGVVLILSALLFPTWSPVQAAGMTCPTPIPVTIDIRPESTTNRINLSAHGVIPVAVLTTRDFDARQFAPEMAHLTDAATATTMGCTGAVAVRWMWRDVNGDRRPDLVFFFRIQDLKFGLRTTAASLMAHGSYRGTPMHIMGTDSVKIRFEIPRFGDD